jgi:transposase-like protein
MRTLEQIGLLVLGSPPAPLSFRDVEDLLAERGIMVSYETVRSWVNNFGLKVAADLRNRRPKPRLGISARSI